MCIRDREQGELLPVGGGVVGAEHGAVAALVAHPVHMEDLMAAVGQLDDHVGPVGAHIGADLAHHVAGQAAVALTLGALTQNALLGNGLRPGGHGLGGNGDFVGLTDEDVYKRQIIYPWAATTACRSTWEEEASSSRSTASCPGSDCWILVKTLSSSR